MSVDPERLQEHFSTTWATDLLPVIETVFTRAPSELLGKKEIVYRKVEQLVYFGFKDKLCAEVESILPKFIPRFDGNEILSVFFKFEKSLSLLAKLFNALDSELIFQSGFGLVSMGRGIWHGWFTQNMKAIEMLVDRVLQLVEKSRHTGSENAEIFQIFDLALKVDIFKNFFEARFIQASLQWYQLAASEEAAKDQMISYISFTERVLENEKNLACPLLPHETWKILETNIKHAIIQAHFPFLIAKHLYETILSSDVENLKKLFLLSNLLDDQILVESVLKHEWANSVQKWISQCLLHESVVEKLLLAKKILNVILSEAFGTKKSFAVTLKDSIESVLNATRVPVPVLLAEFIDAKFHIFIDQVIKGQNGTIALGPELELFKHISSKDIFEVHFRSLLAKRLIHAKFSQLTDVVLPQEQEFINQLKGECGAGFTNKCELMVKDVYVEMSTNFFDACIITSGVWPKNIVGNDYSGNCVPKIVRKWEAKFAEEYKQKFPKKTIKFNYGLSQGIVRYARRDWVCSFSQVCILMLFDSADSMSLDVIVQEIGLNETEILRGLDAIYKAEILSIHGNIVSLNTGIAPKQSSLVALNRYQFIHESTAHASGRMSEEERAAAEATVMEDRQHQLDAGIIRVMKLQKRCSIAYLISEVKTPLFSNSEITRRILSLADREFLQKEGDEVLYLA